jgi:hypothetical protein
VSLGGEASLGGVKPSIKVPALVLQVSEARSELRLGRSGFPKELRHGRDAPG